jgi:hypothetical protein
MAYNIGHNRLFVAVQMKVCPFLMIYLYSYNDCELVNMNTFCRNFDDYI